MLEIYLWIALSYPIYAHETSMTFKAQFYLDLMFRAALTNR